MTETMTMVLALQYLKPLHRKRREWTRLTQTWLLLRLTLPNWKQLLQQSLRQQGLLQKRLLQPFPLQQSALPMLLAKLLT